MPKVTWVLFMGVGHQVNVCPINHQVLDIILQTDWWFDIDFWLVSRLLHLGTVWSTLDCYMYAVPWLVTYMMYLGLLLPWIITCLQYLETANQPLFQRGGPHGGGQDWTRTYKLLICLFWSLQLSLAPSFSFLHSFFLSPFLTFFLQLVLYFSCSFLFSPVPSFPLFSPAPFFYLLLSPAH